MKQIIKITCLPILLGVIIISCSKNTETSVDISNIVGTWQWTKTDGGIGNNIRETPTSTGKNIDLILTSDNKYSFITNGVITTQGTFVIKLKSCIHDHSMKRVIDFSSSNDQDMMVETVDNSNLQLSDDVYDGVLLQYIKK